MQWPDGVQGSGGAALGTGQGPAQQCRDEDDSVPTLKRLRKAFPPLQSERSSLFLSLPRLQADWS